MKDVQKEALAIETEMERRFSDMINRNTQMRYLPKSLTDEIIEHKLKMNEGNLRRGIGEPFEAPTTVGFAQIREAIMEKLGGEFDYVNFAEGIKDVTHSLDDIRREFKTQALLQPIFQDKEKIKAEPFDFTPPVVSVESLMPVEPTKVSYRKPNYLENLETTPLFMIDCDPKELELISKITPASRPMPPTMVGSINEAVSEDPKPKDEIVSSRETTRPVVESKKSTTTVTKIADKKVKED